ncbi:hypothetical protein LCGC14_2314030 [marine sediment metagenome]|uniref:Uncharacterized protein n=1 Tax=marine sediment metagenome TaxID=412755 RepID=A0A0F9EX87_9ZZZZ
MITETKVLRALLAERRVLDKKILRAKQADADFRAGREARKKPKTKGQLRESSVFG